MTNSLEVRIADIAFGLFTDDPDLKIGVDGAMKRFLVAESNPDIRILSRIGDPSGGNKGKKVFDSGALWQLYSQNGSYFFYFTSLESGTLPYKVASFSRDFGKGEVSLNRYCFALDRPIYPLEYPLDELLLIHLLALGRGVEVHACGVVDPSGHGHLFIGQSGAGKSTMAKLWQNTPGVAILSDDRIILRQIDNKLWMYGTPWHGEAMFASPERAPLTRIYFLEKGLKNELPSLRASVALGRLIACSFIPFYSRAGVAFTLDFFEEIIRAVPCYELRFALDKRVVEFVTERSA